MPLLRVPREQQLPRVLRPARASVVGIVHALQWQDDEDPFPGLTSDREDDTQVVCELLEAVHETATRLADKMQHSRGKFGTRDPQHAAPIQGEFGAVSPHESFKPSAGAEQPSTLPPRRAAEQAEDAAHWQDVEVVETFGDMGLQENLLRGIYAYGARV